MKEDREAQVHWRKKERTMTLEGEWAVWAFPQCSIAPAAEGCPILRAPAAAAGHKNAAEGHSAVKGGQSSEKSSSVRLLKSAFTGRGGTRFIGS